MGPSIMVVKVSGDAVFPPLPQGERGDRRHYTKPPRRVGRPPPGRYGPATLLLALSDLRPRGRLALQVVHHGVEVVDRRHAGPGIVDLGAVVLLQIVLL